MFPGFLTMAKQNCDACVSLDLLPAPCGHLLAFWEVYLLRTDLSSLVLWAPHFLQTTFSGVLQEKTSTASSHMGLRWIMPYWHYNLLLFKCVHKTLQFTSCLNAPVVLLNFCFSQVSERRRPMVTCVVCVCAPGRTLVHSCRTRPHFQTHCKQKVKEASEASTQTHVPWFSVPSPSCAKSDVRPIGNLTPFLQTLLVCKHIA